MADLSVQLGPLRLRHPLINCSGTMELLELAETFGPSILEQPPVAAYVAKTMTLEARPGNPPPRILETPSGMINSIGLPGEGLEAFTVSELPRLLELPCPVILSVGGFSVAEYVAAAEGLKKALHKRQGDDFILRTGLELNISCPNVHSGCISIGTDPKETRAVVGAVRKVWPGLLIVKLTPNVGDIGAVGRAAEEAGADAIAAVNTYKGLVIDRHTLRPHLGNVTGGVSGPAIKPLALWAVYELYEAVRVPLVGMGGVATVQDVLEFMACGARVVAVGSAGLHDPCRAANLAAALPTCLKEIGMSLDVLVGRAHGRS